ncbi:MAG: site-specific DNA-methyltransferase [Lachnospiraceae bacterium]|nr:site-specific DNA-methyltransferase [Lachnospiraceae bacterium]
MAAINDLLRQVSDPVLRGRLEEEIDRLSKNKKFGLVFEEHIPECTPLYGVGIRAGGAVARKTGQISDIYVVLQLDDKMAKCYNKVSGESIDIPVDELVAVAQFGEPIFPMLQSVDSIQNAPDSDLWHTLIEADNYHALQLLEYLYTGKVDCIYIDPPYNTRAKDWKYNNDYVDPTDSFKHSKWLSMMKKRLLIAKRLLKPENSVLIVTIDEKEYLHLGCLLNELFPDARIQMVSSMINPANVARAGEFGRSGEYIYFVMLGSASPLRVKLDRDWVSSRGRTHTGNVRWDLLKRSGTNAERRHSPGGFYPIYIDPTNGKIDHLGDPLPPDTSDAPQYEGLYCLLPIRDDGSEGNWQWSKTTFLQRMEQGRVRIGGNADRGFTVYILKDGEYAKILNGEFQITGAGINNEIIVADNDTDYVLAVPGDIWKVAPHDATQYGSRYLGNIFGSKRFTFPKSLYAVRDCLYFFTANNPDALIIDFFAGSGTTLHAVNLLNAEDGGRRRCIMVTNNEVSNDEAIALAAKGLQPGDPEWEQYGIARYVTWPRITCSIKGVDVNGKPLSGNYGVDVERYVADKDGRGKYQKKKIPAYPIMASMKMADGFKANCEYFKLGFMDKDSVSLGRQFREILPLLWLKAGAIGKRPEIDEIEPDMLILPENDFAVLVDETCFARFQRELKKADGIRHVFLVTDSEDAFREMSTELAGRKTYQLYREYIDNFVLGSRRA